MARYKILDMETPTKPRDAGVVTVEGNVLSFSDNTYRSILDIAAQPDIPFIVGEDQKLKKNPDIVPADEDELEPIDMKSKPEKELKGAKPYAWDSKNKVVLAKAGEEYYFEAFKEWLMNLDFVLEEIK